MRIFTCTPVAFGGGPDFFARDSGLLCRGLRSIGVESQAIMPGQRAADDLDELIRTDYGNLESAEWWKSHHLNALVLYAWGSPKFRKVAKAIHDAGIFLILNQDNGGLVSPLAGFRGWWKEQRNLSGGGLAFWRLIAKGLCHGLLVTDPLRSAHLKQGHVIACVSPLAARHYQKLCLIYGGENLARRVQVIPHAVEPEFRFSGSSKNHQVCCVGRWDDHVQKRPDRLIETISELLAFDTSVTVVIVGQPTEMFVQWRCSLPESQRERVCLKGRVGRTELVGIFNESQVFYSPSAFESFGIAAAEALCCGCSVVAGKSVSMSAFDWFVSGDSGTLAERDTTHDHVNALQTELSAWKDNRRDALTVSQTWCQRLHADQVAHRVVAQVQSKETRDAREERERSAELGDARREGRARKKR